MDNFETHVKSIRTFARSKKYPVMRVKTCKVLDEKIKEYEKIYSGNEINVLEIGTCLGISGLTILNASQKTKLTTIEINEDTYKLAKVNFDNAGFSHRVNQLLGDCVEIVSYMYGNQYDIILIDGPKSKYEEITKMCLPMLKINGFIFADDILYHGMVFSEYNDHKQRTIVNALRHYLKYIEENDSLVSTQIKIEDGILIAKKIK